MLSSTIYTLGGPWFRDHQFCDHADLWYKEEALAFPSMNIPESQIPEKGSDSERISMW